MNTNLDENFQEALELSNTDFSHNELLEFLKTGTIVQKQFAALSLDTINNLSEGEILVSNLTGCDGKIREAVSLKIHSLLIDTPEKSEFLNFPEIFADAAIDINPNVCRLVVESVMSLKKFPDFSQKYLHKILKFTNESLDELDRFIFRDKKYVINKQIFKLYWCLESLKLFLNEIPQKDLITIIKRITGQKEYTIREKAAEILVKINLPETGEFKKQLQNDENYYVRRVFLNH